MTRTIHAELRIEGLATPPGYLDLPYVYYRRGTEPRPTVFFLGGGPGVSNLKWVPPESWLRDFDVVVLEYRGVGKSSIELESNHFRRALQEPIDSLSLPAAQAMQAAFAAGFADLRTQGVRFEEFSVSALADDLERLRRHLGLSEVYLVAHSFGTRAALLYQTRYRERVPASILFALNTPGGFIWYPADTQRVWTRYRDALAKTRPDLHADLSALLKSPLPRKSNFGPFEVNDAKALVVAFFMSFNGGSRDVALRALAAARNGSAGKWYLFSLSYDWIVRFGFNWADFFVKAYTADCDRASIERLDEQGRNSLFQSPSSVLFSAADAFEAAGGRCVPNHFEPDYRDTLVITGEFDPSTPVERKPAALPAERFIVVPGAGHAEPLYGNPEATGAWLRRFFLRAESAAEPSRAARSP